LTGKQAENQNMTENEVDAIIKEFCPYPEFHPNLSILVTTFWDMMEANGPTGSKRTPGLGWYSKRTCFEFHKLLVSALVAYANALLRFHSVTSKLKRGSDVEIADLKKQQPVLAQQLWKCGYLLWRIAESRILCHHLKLLDATLYLITPTRSTAPGRNIFTGTGPGEGVDEREEKVDQKADDETNVEEDDDDQTEEFWRMKELPVPHEAEDPDIPNLDAPFLRWMRLQASHWIAQDLLMSPQVLPKAISQRLQIFTVKVKFPSDADRKMESWETVLMDLEQDFPNRFNVRDTIATIKEQIDNT